MHEMTKANLEAAFVGESQAHMRYLAFAAAAEKEGRPNIARLFRAIAYAEQVHAINHLRELAGINDTKVNLQGAIDGENFEVAEMYPAYDAVAKLQDESGAVRSIHFAIEAEKIHADMYTQAKQAAESGKDAEIGKVYICPVCGYTAEGETPEKCPVCGAPQEMFKEF